MLPYRYSFETDAQYQARVQELTPPTPVVSTAPKAVTSSIPNSDVAYQAPQNTTTATTSPTAAPVYHQSQPLLAGWTIVVIAFLLLVIAFYESYRRKLTALLNQSRPTNAVVRKTPTAKPTKNNNAGPGSQILSAYYHHWLRLKRKIRQMRLALRARHLGIEEIFPTILIRYGWRNFHPNSEIDFTEDRPLRRALGHWRNQVASELIPN